MAQSEESDSEQMESLLSLSVDRGESKKPSSSSSAAAPTPRVIVKRLLVVIGLTIVPFLAVMRVLIRSGRVRGAATAKKTAKQHHQGEDVVLSTHDLTVALSKSRQELGQKLKNDYGSHYETIFGRNVNETVFANDASKERLMRRIMMKVLSSMVAKKQESGNNGSTSNTATFTWVTAGHSAAAAHGNLYSQSYTAVLESAARDAFASVGINFVAKNYAMGGMSSGPELALCMESVYGSDIDALLWDFGMTDNKWDSKSALWGNRAGVHPTRPILFIRTARNGYYQGRWKNYEALEEKSGMGTVRIDSSALYDDLKEVLPDAGKMESQENVTPALKFFVCNGGIEYGDPCFDHKYDVRPCKEAKYQVSWHPGWKDHMLQGNLMATFLLKMLDESMNELDRLLHPQNETEREPPNVQSLLASLHAQEQSDLEVFRNSEIVYDMEKEEDQKVLDEVNSTIVFRKQAVCHTALLPSQVRYNGILTESGNKGGVWGGYDLGMSRRELDGKAGANGTFESPAHLPLIYNDNERQECNTTLGVDYKDLFFVREADGWVSTLVPNDSEVEAYGKDLQREGLIMMCLLFCKKCPDDYISFDELRERDGNITIEVDGEPVVGVKTIYRNEQECSFLVGKKHGLRWGGTRGGRGLSKKRQYELKFRANRPGGKLYVSSVVVW